MLKFPQYLLATFIIGSLFISLYKRIINNTTAVYLKSYGLSTETLTEHQGTLLH